MKPSNCKWVRRGRMLRIMWWITCPLRPLPLLHSFEKRILKILTCSIIFPSKVVSKTRSSPEMDFLSYHVHTHIDAFSNRQAIENIFQRRAILPSYPSTFLASTKGPESRTTMKTVSFSLFCHHYWHLTMATPRWTLNGREILSDGCLWRPITAIIMTTPAKLMREFQYSIACIYPHRGILPQNPILVFLVLHHLL